MDTKEQLCAEAPPCEPESPETRAEVKEETLFPDFIKAQNGTGITFYNRKKGFPVRVRYGSIVSACLTESSVAEPTDSLKQYMTQGFLEDRNGEFNQELVLPIDFVTLPSGENCAVLATDLSGCVQGFSNLQMQKNADGRNVFEVLGKLAKAVGCLKDNGLHLTKWDGHQLFTCVEYGVLAMVLDGMDLVIENIPEETSHSGRELAAVLLCCLTGAFPVDGEGVPYGTLIDAPASAVLRFDGTAQTVCSDDPQAAAFWNSLPQKVREAFEDCFFRLEAPCRDAYQWAEFFEEMAQTAESERCIHCGKTVFASVMECPFCQGNLDKRKLMSRWLVTDNLRSLKFGLAMPANMMLDCAMLSADFPKGKLFQIGYSAKRNVLALKNISSEPMTVDYGDLGTIQAEPQSIFLLKIGMQITVTRKRDITMTLLGFDLQDSWEAE